MSRSGQRDLWGHGKLNVAGARRHVDHQNIQLTPIDIAHHLLKGRLNHRSTPNHRRVFFNQKSHGHDLDAKILHGIKGFAIGRSRPTGNAHHARHGRAVNIRIQQAHLVASGCQTQGQIDRSG